MNELSSTLSYIIKNAGEIICEKINQKHIYFSKSKNNFVTDIDYYVQDYLIEQLTPIIPAAGIISEETPSTLDLRDNETVWIIDPIDGTTNFIHNYPHVCVSIALIKNQNVMLGFIYNPVSKELFHAHKGGGAFLNNNKINVSETSLLEDSLIGFGYPYDKNKTNKMSDLVKKIVVKIQDFRRSGSSALDMAYVACGRLDGFFEYDLEIWDYAAASLLISESNGKITDWNDKQLLNLGKNNILATNHFIHADLKKQIDDKFEKSYEY